MKPWQKYVLVALTFAIAGFGYGRFVAPEKTVVEDHSEEVTRLRQQNATLTDENTRLRKHTVKETETVIVYRDGKPATKTVKAKEDTHVDRTKDTRTDVKIDTDATSVKLVDRIVTTESILPRWTVTASAGFDFTSRTPVYGGSLAFNFKFPILLKQGHIGAGLYFGPVVRMGTLNVGGSF